MKPKQKSLGHFLLQQNGNEGIQVSPSPVSSSRHSKP